ncbi:MAG: ubiquinone biosynthesis regulatory protein kinase UbiB [Pseudomonadales bacterium]
MNRLLRLLKIFAICNRYRLDEFLHFAPGPLRWFFFLSPWRLLPNPKKSRAERLRLALEALGPIFIKFGQMLSTRRDLLPEDIADELRRLQDQVPPFCGAEATRLIEEALDKPVSEMFAEFSTEPLASASVAQVHKATLHSGEAVVVKVIRPKIHKTIEQDIQLLHTLAQLIERYSEDGKRLRPMEVVSDYEKTIFNELDLLIEAGNTSQLHRNFENSELLYIPQIHWEYCRRNVLVMERIHGIPVADIPALAAQNTDMKKLAERGVEIFFTQVFRDSFFHADMHPGNIFVSRENPASPQYIAIDCGIVGTLSNDDKNYLARILLAFFRRDYRKVATLHIDSGWIPDDTPVAEFETAIRSVCEPIFEKPLKEISFGQVLLGLFQTIRRFDMEIQPQLVLLQKTLLNIEGLGRQIYPDLDLWNTAMPYLESWMRERNGPKALLKNLRDQGPDWLEQSHELPQLIFDTLQQSRHIKTLGEQQAHAFAKLQQQERHQQQTKRRNNRLGWLATGALALAAIFATNQGSNVLAEIPPISWVLGVAALVLLLNRH